VSTAHRSIEPIDPRTAIEGPVLVLAPHSDDETLGCGATIALIADAMPVHVAYGADGRISPAGPDGKATPDAASLVKARAEEARDAMAMLGVPAEHLHFLAFPDSRLTAEQARLETAIADLLDRLRPRTVIAPFRHDQHPDHLAMHRAAVGILRARPDVRLLQYFVYYRYPLLAERDIRRAVAPRHCVAVNATPVRALKRRALECYRSQVQLYYPWQTRPVLVPTILDEHCADTEQFVMATPDLPDPDLFSVYSLRLRFNLRYGARVVRCKKAVAQFIPGTG